MRPSVQLLIFSVVVFSLMAAGCGQKREAEDEYRLVEYIKVEGECSEDHVKRSAKYDGEIVHWHNLTKDSDSRYGSVHNQDSVTPEAIAARIQHPYDYAPPFTVEFSDLRQEDIAGTTLRLKGISEHLGTGDRVSGPRYWTTCDVRVVERLDHVPPKWKDADDESRGERGRR